MAPGSFRTYLFLDSPISKNYVAGKYWGIDATIRYGSGNGGVSVGLSSATAGIVDTGTTLVYLSTGKSLRDHQMYVYANS